LAISSPPNTLVAEVQGLEERLLILASHQSTDPAGVPTRFELFPYMRKAWTSDQLTKLASEPANLLTFEKAYGDTLQDKGSRRKADQLPRNHNPF